jgi:hypothetical protein
MLAAEFPEGLLMYVDVSFRGSGWWFGAFFIFPYIGNKHPN